MRSARFAARARASHERIARKETAKATRYLHSAFFPLCKVDSWPAEYPSASALDGLPAPALMDLGAGARRSLEG